MQLIHPHDTRWHPADGDDGPLAHPPVQAHALLTIEQWHAVRDHWPSDLAVGVALPNTTDVMPLAADLPRLQLVVLQFPKWTDGRAYSQARLLRSRLRYAGELRADGDVVADMLPLLQRCGFSSARLRADQNPETARRALHFIGDHYQADANGLLPLFIRKAA